jgi:outer membrane autotransporter protein
LNDSVNYWNGSTTTPDGSASGGDGVWNGSSTNWTNPAGTEAGTFNPQAMLIFAGTPGTITVEGEQPVNGGLQFFASGYRVRGGRLALGGNTLVRVGDGTPASAGFSASLDSELTGQGGLSVNGSDTIQGIDGAGATGDLGTLVLGGNNSYSGGTRVFHGKVVGSAASFGSGAIELRNTDATLDIDQASDANMNNAIEGVGRFTKRGAGRLNYTGNGGFSGATTVQAGTLAVNGSLSQSVVSVDAGAKVGGNGTIGGLIVHRNATAAPGNSIGHLHVAGNVTFEAGSVYEVEADAAGNADRISATGSATLQGGAVSVLAGQGNYAANTRYTILSADGGVSGQFASASSNLAFLTPTLSYQANAVDLTLTRNDVGFVDVSGSRNQRAAGAAVEALGAGNALWDTVVGRLDAAGARNAFDQLSGEAHASAQTALMENSRFVREAALARPTAGAGTHGWAQLLGAWGRSDGDGNAAKLRRDASGLLLGADTALAEHTRAGGVIGYSRDTFKVGDRASSGRSNDVHLGAYVGTSQGQLRVRAGLAATWHDIDNRRDVNFGGYADSVRSNTKARTTQVFGEAGYALPTPVLTLEPFVGLAAVQLKSDGFSERGGAAALSADAATLNTRFSTLGLHLSSPEFALGGVQARFNGTLGWRHAFGDVTPTTTLAFAGGAAFAVQGVPIARTATLVEAGLTLAVGKDATLNVAYSGQFGSGISDNGIKLGLNLKF